MKNNILRFYITIFLFSWIPWGIAIFSNGSQGDVFINSLIAIGGIAPMFATILFILFSKTITSIKYNFTKRLFGFNNISTKYYILILFLAPILVIVSILISLLFNQPISQFTDGIRDFGSFSGFLSTLVFVLIFGPIPEEIGWRGLGLDLLYQKNNKLVSSIILGIIWSIWHLPLFFINGTYQNTEIFNFLGMLNFFLTIIPTCIVISWFYFKTNRMILSAILFHWSSNFSGYLFAQTAITRFIYLILILLIVLIDIYIKKSFWFANNNE